MKRGDMIHVWIIRYSDGSAECNVGNREEAIQVADQRVKDANLTYEIIE